MPIALTHRVGPLGWIEVSTLETLSADCGAIASGLVWARTDLARHGPPEALAEGAS